MVKFSELNKKRQTLVCFILNLFPETRNTGLISLREIKEMMRMNDEGIIKQPSYPLWIYGEHQFRTETRGVYRIPIPDEDDINNSKNDLKPRASDIIESPNPKILTIEEFEYECRQAGIK